MYKNTKSRITVNGNFSEFFPCTVGVRQGENLSPLLFALYMNDLEQFLIDTNIIGLKTINDDLVKELDVYMKLFLLLYADDTVLMSESKDDLQYMLNNFCVFCKQWKLSVNVSKTKVVIFSKGRLPKNVSFNMDGKNIEIVNAFKYLGVFFSRSGSFIITKKYLADRATKAMFCVLKKSRNLNLSIECQ